MALIKYLFILFLCLFVGRVDAQQVEEKRSPKHKLEWIIKGECPPTKNIMFLVDTSGSMEGVKIQSAIEMAMQIAETPVDDLQIAIVSFDSHYSRWLGTVDIDSRTKKPISRRGWSLMPSKINLDKAFKWLQSNIRNGDTDIVPALGHAFKSSMKIDDISIIIISDCEFYYIQDHGRRFRCPFDRIEATIREYQNVRKKAKLKPATIGIFGIDVNTADNFDVKNLVGNRVIKKVGNRVISRWVADLCILGYCVLKYYRRKIRLR